MDRRIVARGLALGRHLLGRAWRRHRQARVPGAGARRGGAGGDARHQGQPRPEGHPEPGQDVPELSAARGIEGGGAGATAGGVRGARSWRSTLGHVFSNAVRTLPAVAADVLAARPRPVARRGWRRSPAPSPPPSPWRWSRSASALDRYGVRRTALALLAIGGVGAVLAALAGGAAGMLLAQVVLGIGCSGHADVPDHLRRARPAPCRASRCGPGIIQAVGNTGMLLSASPLALLVEWQGWRAGFWACGRARAASPSAAVALLVRQPPPPRGTRRGRCWQDAREVLAIAGSPALRPLMVFAFAVLRRGARRARPVGRALADGGEGPGAGGGGQHAAALHRWR